MDVIAQVVVPSQSLIPADAVMNTWAIGGTESNEASIISAISSSLFQFYTVTPVGGTNAVWDYCGAQYSHNLAELRLYRRTDPEPRVPFYAGPINGVGPQPAPDYVSEVALPEEVALCMSFQAAQTSGQPQARRRGRVYIGPLNDGALSGATDTPARPASIFREDLALAGGALLAALQGGDLGLAVWSRVDDVFRLVTNGWVDNAFDTQRRRGVSPNSRLTFSL